MPAHGDFVSRGMDDETVASGDTVLAEAIALAAHRWDAQWDDVYIETPVWRFMATPGVFGAMWTAGIFMASVDAVGRQYPLVSGFAAQTLALLAHGPATTAALDEAEAVARAALLDLLPIDAAHERLDDIAVKAFGDAPLALGQPAGFAVRQLSRLEAKPWTPESVWWVAGGGSELRLQIEGALTREALSQLFRPAAAPQATEMAAEAVGSSPADAPSSVVSDDKPADPAGEPDTAGISAEAEKRE